MAEWKRANAFALSWRNVIRGMVAGLAGMLALAAGAAALLSRGLMPLESINYVAAGILLITGLLCAAVAGKGGGSDAAMAAGCVWLILLWINAAFYGFAPKGLPSGLLPIFGGAGAWMLMKNERKYAGRRQRRKYRHR